MKKILPKEQKTQASELPVEMLVLILSFIPDLVDKLPLRCVCQMLREIVDKSMPKEIDAHIYRKRREEVEQRRRNKEDKRQRRNSLMSCCFGLIFGQCCCAPLLVCLAMGEEGDCAKWTSVCLGPLCCICCCPCATVTSWIAFPMLLHRLDQCGCWDE